jgi:hypothetical protein
MTSIKLKHVINQCLVVGIEANACMTHVEVRLGLEMKSLLWPVWITGRIIFICVGRELFGLKHQTSNMGSRAVNNGWIMVTCQEWMLRTNTLGIVGCWEIVCLVAGKYGRSCPWYSGSTSAVFLIPDRDCPPATAIREKWQGNLLYSC